MALVKKTVYFDPETGKEYSTKAEAGIDGRTAGLVKLISEATSPAEAVKALLAGYRVSRITGQKRPRKAKEAAVAPAVAEGKPGKANGKAQASA